MKTLIRWIRIDSHGLTKGSDFLGSDFILGTDYTEACALVFF